MSEFKLPLPDRSESSKGMPERLARTLPEKSVRYYSPLDSLSAQVQDKVVERIEAHYQQLRTLALELPQTERSADLRAVHDFFKQLDLSTSPYAVLSEEDYTAITTQLPDFTHSATDSGQYSGLVDLVIIGSERGPRLQEKLVHELAHSSGIHVIEFSANMEQGITHRTGRLGFATFQNGEKYGDFLEEGFAQMLAGAYTELRSDASEPLYIDALDLTIPGKYVDDERNFSPNAIPALGMELLIAKDPSLLETLVSARHTPEALFIMQGQVNALSNRLYEKLTAFPESLQGQFAGLKQIINDLYEGDLSVTSALPQDTSHILSQLLGQ